MNARLFTAALATAALAGSLAACGGANSVADHVPAKSSWVTVHGAGFTAKLPEKPSSTTKSVPTAAGKISTTIYALEANHDALGINSAVYPKGMRVNLDGAVDGAASNTGTKVLESQKTTLDGSPARKFRLGGSYQGHDVTVFGLAAAHGQTMLLVQYDVVGKNVTTTPAVYQQIMDSLAFTG